MTMSDRERDRRSLQDLAKLAQSSNLGMTSPPSSRATSGVQRSAPTLEAKPDSQPKTDDSGIVDLAAAQVADPEAETRAKSTALASQGLFEDDGGSIRPPPMSADAAPVMQPIPSLPPVPASLAPAAPSVSPAAPMAAQAAPAPAKKSRSTGVVIALSLGSVLVVSAAAAAGVLFYFKQHNQTATTSEPVAMKVAETPAVPRATAPVAEPQPAPEPVAAAEETPSTPAKVAAKGQRPVHAKAGAPKDTAPAAEAPKADEPAKMTQKDLPKYDGPPGDLGKEMQKAVGADGKPVEQTPAAGNNGPQFAAGSVPQKPSQGAVTGALGAVLPAARSCLGPDDPISRASVTFGSNGTVQSVTVSGGAAGKAAESCIRGALTKARVTPFAESTYTAPVTIRHN